MEYLKNFHSGLQNDDVYETKCLTPGDSHTYLVDVAYVMENLTEGLIAALHMDDCLSIVDWKDKSEQVYLSRYITQHLYSLHSTLTLSLL
jgi:hypothetical protein